MLHKLISHNLDLKRLFDDGYELEIRNTFLLVNSIPYVSSQKQVLHGKLVTALELSGEKTVPPRDHVIHFIGEFPSDRDGNPLKGIQQTSGKRMIGEGIEIDHSFSNKPSNGYPDYYEKITNYIRIISAHAASLDPTSTAKTHKPIQSDDPETVFHYLDTNSSRAEIDPVSDKLKNLKIAIIGLGGTGSYILDFVSKTPVREIHIYDNDNFFSHNAFRAPGAVSIDNLNKKLKKVEYLYSEYSKMHKYIISHPYYLTQENLNELTDLNFVFICIDDGESKKEIINKLVQSAIPFIDVGIGIQNVDGSLFGNVRVTTCTSQKSDHLEKWISYSDKEDNEYIKNIQIAEINALNASLAVIKWKKFFGFYLDQGKENNTLYDIGGNILINDDEYNS